MTNQVESMVISLGNEPAEILGFKTEEQIETALLPLMEEVFTNETISLNQTNSGEIKRQRCEVKSLYK
tara:strand:- start:47 stop:250 length:204 start_codon:yes stop_codon:yes gene_type:complete